MPFGPGTNGGSIPYYDSTSNTVKYVKVDHNNGTTGIDQLPEATANLVRLRKAESDAAVMKEELAVSRDHNKSLRTQAEKLQQEVVDVKTRLMRIEQANTTVRHDRDIAEAKLARCQEHKAFDDRKIAAQRAEIDRYRALCGANGVNEGNGQAGNIGGRG